jgi:hypothetical protein
MDFSVYLTEVLVRERLREAERLAGASQWVEEAWGRRRRSLRVALGRAMIRAGRWVLGQAPDGPALGR